MKPYVLLLPQRKEMLLLTSAVQFMLKKRGSSQFPACFQRTDQLSIYLESMHTVQMMICDVTYVGAIPVLEELRSRNPDMRLILVADQTVPPVSYIRPTILPTALLWRPVDSNSISKTLWEVIAVLPDDGRKEDDKEQQFALELRGVRQQFSYKDILFFESREKRLCVHLQRREIPFPGTLENLSQTLPEEFIRVHKSYIVNRTRISQVQFGQNLITLDNGMMLPISRSYKADVKAVFA